MKKKSNSGWRFPGSSLVRSLLAFGLISVLIATSVNAADVVDVAVQEAEALFFDGQTAMYNPSRNPHCQAQPANGCRYRALQLYNRVRDIVSPRSAQQRVAFDYAGMLNDLGILSAEFNDFDTAVSAYEEAIRLDNNLLSAVVNLAGLYTTLGNYARAEELYDRSLQLSQLSPIPAVLHNYGVFLFKLGRTDEAKFLWEYAISIDSGGQMYWAEANLATVTCTRGDIFEAQTMLDQAISHASLAGDSAAMVGITLLKASAQVPVINFNNTAIDFVRSQYSFQMKALIDKSTAAVLSDPLQSVGCGCLGYYLIYHGFEDLGLRQVHAAAQWHLTQGSLQFVSPHVSKPRRSSSNRIRVGFLSAFFYRHSVGILLQGVIKNIDRRIFEVIVIAANQDQGLSDSVTDSLLRAVRKESRGGDNMIFVQGTLSSLQSQIANLDLDILVFGEIGMDLMTYFLAFSQLARRSVVFWGHAVSSGIGAADCLSGSILNPSQGRCESILSGPDYFVSSVLFEGRVGTHSTSTDLRFSQLEYSERLILMDGITTYFELPVDPLSRSEIGDKGGGAELPLKREFLVHTDNSLEGILPADFHLYGLPQTLYKLHPDFDAILINLLRSDPLAIIAVPRGQNYVWAESVIRRIKEAGRVNFALSSTQMDEYLTRVIFVRSLNAREYLTLCAVSDVILDPFPVGGGRSSLEALSVGTPIVLMPSRTSILQLTLGMYDAMGVSNVKKMCVARDFSGFVRQAIQIASDRALSRSLRQEILDARRFLYNNRSVIQEWEKMLRFVHYSPRPERQPTRANQIDWSVFGGSLEDVFRTNPLWRKDEFMSTIFPFPQQPILLRDIADLSESQHQQQQHQQQQQQQQQIDVRFNDQMRNGTIRELVVSIPTLESIQGHEQVMADSADNNWASDCVYQLQNLQGLSDKLKIIYICSVIGKQRLRTRNRHFTSVSIQLDASDEAEDLVLYEGDDLGQVIYMLRYSNGFLSELSVENLAILARHIEANHLPVGVMGSESWIRQREKVSLNLIWATNGATSSESSMSPKTRKIFGLDEFYGFNYLQTDERSTPKQAQVVVAITTCRRLSHFVATVDALIQALGPLPNSIITQVIVVDDNSSAEDRMQMKLRYPSFKFILKNESDKGHAKSMNIIIREVIRLSLPSRETFLLYLEDDWRVLRQPVLHHSLGRSIETLRDNSYQPSNFGRHAFNDLLELSVSLLQTTSDFDQILFNDQVSRSCAVASSTCDHRLVGRGGWHRSFNISASQVLSAIGEAAHAFENAAVDIEFSICRHEFGLLQMESAYAARIHDFTYWPSLSLNPGLWRLSSITSRLLPCIRQEEAFSTSDDLFEHRFTASAFACGLRMAYLPALVFEHIGDISAYNLNNQSRPW